MFKSKWMIIAISIVTILVILLVIGRKSVHTETIIGVSSAEVWRVLTDTENIKEWNPVLIPIEGELKEGNTITYEFRQDPDNISTMPAKVKQIDETKLLNQGGGMPGILTFDHKYILEQVEEGTKVIIHEDYRGIMVPFWNPAPVEKAYARLLEALRDRVNELKNQNEPNTPGE